MNLCLYVQDAAGFRGFNKIFKKNQVETRHALSLLIQLYYPELVEQNCFQYTFDIMYEKWDFLYYQVTICHILKNSNFEGMP